ncbi:GntR family transcriptional regulator [Tsukamurella soli]|uniref:GntR family transcriptional regulator n=1 Tax=Tsukamurella soli TaxID=644556 RepID=A0ABP8JT66_9ACTN
MMKTGGRTAAEQAYLDVKERILRGDIAGGELLSEGEVAGGLGCSRTPVREAFLRLEAEGWMRLYPKRGALVLPVDPAEGRRVVEARRIVENAAAERICAAGAGPDLLCRLADLIDTQLDSAAAGDADGYAAADADFHRAMVAELDNPLLEAFYDSLRERQRRMTTSTIGVDPERIARAVGGHRALAAALAAGDRQRFATELTSHLKIVLGDE